jgi:haloacetate dehalogenase
MFSGFCTSDIATEGATIFARWSGTGAPVLLLHGFPQTHAMWHAVAPLLAQRFTVVCADLRGYGRSGCPPSRPDHAPYAKRAMAADMVGVMQQLGFERFAVVGHDRGARVAYRMALDHPQRIVALAVLDVVPIEEAWRRADARLALGFWPWSLLAQQQPLPERLLLGAPEAVLDDALGAWGTPACAFTHEARQTYLDALRDPAHVHAICEEFRAAASLDREHDRADLAAGRRIACPVLVLWSAAGALGTWYAQEGGPLVVWAPWARNLHGQALDAGHFFPEEKPRDTTGLLAAFLASHAAQ